MATLALYHFNGFSHVSEGAANDVPSTMVGGAGREFWMFADQSSNGYDFIEVRKRDPEPDPEE